MKGTRNKKTNLSDFLLCLGLSLSSFTNFAI